MTSFELWLVGLGGRTVGLGVNTATLVILSRALGPVGRGQYFLFVTLLLVLTAVSDLGISQSAVVFGGRPEVGVRRIHGVILRLAPAIAVGAVVVGFVALRLGGAGLLVGMPDDWLFVAAALLPLSVYGNYWTALMIGARRIVAVNAMQLGASLLMLVATMTLVASTGSSVVAIAVYGGVSVLEGIAMFVVATRGSGLAVELTDGPSIARDMIAFGVRAYPGSVGSLLWARAAVFVLNVFHGPSAVGIYSVGQQLAEKALVPVQALQDLIYARMARLPRAQATAELDRYLRLTVAAIVPTILLAIVISPLLVTILFSESLSGSGLALRLLLAGSAVQAVSLILAPYFLAQLRRPGLLSLLSWMNAALNVALLIALVPAAAEVGAAAAMLITQACGTLLVLILYLRIGATSPRSALVLRRDDVSLVRDQALGLTRR